MINKYNFGHIQKIRSKKILKDILLFLPKFQELNLFKYNKFNQKKIGLDLKDYKNESQKERKIENDNFCEEYILGTNIRIFEGEFLFGKKNGKGKEYYYNGKLKFEGEYLEGKRLKGIGYDIKGKIILELKYKQGEEYYDNGNLKFFGEYYNGKRWNGEIYNNQGEKINEIKYGQWEVIHKNINAISQLLIYFL